MARASGGNKWRKGVSYLIIIGLLCPFSNGRNHHKRNIVGAAQTNYNYNAYPQQNTVYTAPIYYTKGNKTFVIAQNGQLYEMAYSNANQRQDWHDYSNSMPSTSMQIPNDNDNGMKPCKGRDNLSDDLELVGMLTDFISIVLGYIATGIGEILAYTNNPNNKTELSVFSLLFWLPAIFDIKSGFSLPTRFVRVITGLSRTYFNNYSNGQSEPLEDFLSNIADGIGIFSFVIGTILTFPDWYNALIDLLYRVSKKRRKWMYLIENYGCSVPRVFAIFGVPIYDFMSQVLVYWTNMIAANKVGGQYQYSRSYNVSQYYNYNNYNNQGGF